MMRKGAFAAVVLAVGLIAPLRAAEACEPGAKACACKHHGSAAAADASGGAHEADQARAHAALVEAGRNLLAAKCSCGSKADCTCKKGQCKCAKCRGRHDVLESLQEQGGGGQPVQDARLDASAGELL
jgi:hypothetical protein